MSFAVNLNMEPVSMPTSYPGMKTVNKIEYSSICFNKKNSPKVTFSQCKSFPLLETLCSGGARIWPLRLIALAQSVFLRHLPICIFNESAILDEAE